MFLFWGAIVENERKRLNHMGKIWFDVG